MRVNPLQSYDEAEYPSIKDACSGRKPGGGVKGTAALIMASLTAMAISSCNPDTIFDGGRLSGEATMEETTASQPYREGTVAGEKGYSWWPTESEETSQEMTRTAGIVPEEGWFGGENTTPEETEEIMLAGDVAYSETGVTEEYPAEVGDIIGEY